MKHLPVLILALCVVFCTGGYCLGRLHEHKYYDGEGNKISSKVVDLFVRSQFIKTTTLEDSLINKYFYFNNDKK